MSLQFTPEGHLVIEEAGRTALDTSAPMLNLAAPAKIELTDFAIEFPSFWFGVEYLQYRDTGGIGETTGCATFSALVEQEWGPDEAAPHFLEDQVVGTVPEGTDYLEVWINISRTTSADNILGLDFVPLIPENQWVKLEGGSCMPEKQSGISRLFEFVLVGTDVVLRRYQSVRAGGGWTRVNGSASQGNKNFFFAGPNAPEHPSKTAILGTKIQNKSSYAFSVGTATTHRPSGKEAGSTDNVPCSTSRSGISYRSVWQGTIRITPGRIGAP